MSIALVVGVHVELVNADETVQSLGEGVLRPRGDVTALPFDGRDAKSRTGRGAPDRARTKDLDGDGFEDYIISDVDASDRPLLRVVRREANRRTHAGEASQTGADAVCPGRQPDPGRVGRQMITTDRLVSTDGVLTPNMNAANEPCGLLGAIITARAPNGDIQSVEVLHPALKDNGAEQGPSTVRPRPESVSASPYESAHANAWTPQRPAP